VSNADSLSDGDKVNPLAVVSDPLRVKHLSLSAVHQIQYP